MKIILFYACVALTLSAAANADNGTKTSSSADIASKKTAFYRNTGGFIFKPGSNAGKVSIIDAQDRFNRSEIESSAKSIGSLYRIDVKVVVEKINGIGDAVAAVKRSGGATGVVVALLDPALPALIVLPDECCAIVNVAAFPKECGLELLRRQIARGFASVSGAMSSQVTPSLMSAFNNQRKLAAFPVEVIPADVGVRVKNTLRNLGVTPYIMSTYKRACKEGWAPAPTNDIQRAIWEKVHAIPDKPLKIEFDPKKDK